MGFEIEEEPEEEVPYSFKEYLLQPVKFSSRVFRGMILNPKLKYWLLALLVGSIFITLGTYSMMQKLNIEVVVGGEIPEDTAKLVKGMMDLFMRNPAILYMESLLSNVLMQVIAGLVLQVLTKIFTGRSSFSASLMVVGLNNVPSILYGIFMWYLGSIMPEITWTIEISPNQASLGGGTAGNLPEEIVVQQSALNLMISLWTLLIFYAACRYGFKMTRGKAIATAVIAWLAINVFAIYQMFTVL